MSQLQEIDFPVKRLRAALTLPEYMTAAASGMDLRAAIDAPITLLSLERVLVPTGLAFAIPQGYELQVRPRSGLALKHGLSCLNTPGTIDADYRGEVKVLLVNLSKEPFVIEPGERIAQIVCAPVIHAKARLVEELPETVRGREASATLVVEARCCAIVAAAITPRGSSAASHAGKPSPLSNAHLRAGGHHLARSARVLAPARTRKPAETNEFWNHFFNMFEKDYT